MMTDAFGEQPVLGTIKQCQRTQTGWRGVMEDGTVMDTKASILPVRKVKYVVSLGDEKNNNRPVLGVYLLKWRQKGGEPKSVRQPAKSPRYA
jgi:hypothetical protein